jgi:hypothetical protein
MYDPSPVMQQHHEALQEVETHRCYREESNRRNLSGMILPKALPRL